MPSRQESKRAIGVGRRLASARLRRGLSQSTLSRLTGIAASYLSRIETGKIQPTYRTVVRIADALEVPLVELTGPGSSSGSQRGACPVSEGGTCLLDLIRSEAAVERGGEAEAYTPRQIRLLQQFARWLRGAKPDRVRAMEILFEELQKR